MNRLLACAAITAAVAGCESGKFPEEIAAAEAGATAPAPAPERSPFGPWQDPPIGAAPQQSRPIAPQQAAPPLAPTPTEDWNDAEIAWEPLEPGLARAAKTRKPLCLIIYTTWCPHCKNYSHVFHDPRVVEQTKGFVMVRIDQDRDQTASAKYAPDGQYVPRTYFLAPDGRLDTEIHAARDRFKFFYAEHDPADILQAMQTARKKLL